MDAHDGRTSAAEGVGACPGRPVPVGEPGLLGVMTDAEVLDALADAVGAMGPEDRRALLADVARRFPEALGRAARRAAPG